LLLHTSCAGLIEYVVGAHDSGTPVTMAATSGRPVVAPAWSLQLTMSSTLLRNSAEVPTSAKSFSHAVMAPLRASLGLSFESRKSTTTLRPATPPPPAVLLRYLAPARTPSTIPWNSPGTNGLSTSASTAMCTSVGETPTSEAFGFSLLDCAVAGTAATATRAAVATNAVRMVWRVVMFPPRNG
jgi:hypothetical protein